jgi:hypothetical protein
MGDIYSKYQTIGLVWMMQLGDVWDMVHGMHANNSILFGS